MEESRSGHECPPTSPGHFPLYSEGCILLTPTWRLFSGHRRLLGLPMGQSWVLGNRQWVWPSPSSPLRNRDIWDHSEACSTLLPASPQGVSSSCPWERLACWCTLYCSLPLRISHLQSPIGVSWNYLLNKLRAPKSSFRGYFQGNSKTASHFIKIQDRFKEWREWQLIHSSRAAFSSVCL